MTIGRRACRLGHHHRIAPAPFVAITPDPGGGEQSAIGKREPATRLAALRPFGLRPRRKRDQAAPFREAVAPEKAVELVGARIVDRLGLERLPFRALAAERETPRHRDQRPIGHHHAGIAGKDLLPEVRAAKLVDRIEPARDFGVRFGHTVEIAHGCWRSGWALGCLGRPKRGSS